jgi:hypothetical protein
MSSNYGISLLAETLSGTAATEGEIGQISSSAHTVGVAASQQHPSITLGPLVSHLRHVVREAVDVSHRKAPTAEAVATAGQKIGQLCFAIQSAVGAAKLSPTYEEQLWELVKMLWVRGETHTSAYRPWQFMAEAFV